MSAFSLTAEELRVLACLIEKSHTTPDQYPLSTNGLVTACNQRTSRDPVVEYSAALVDRTMQLLRDGGWARTLMASGSRVAKHRHIADERLGLDTPSLAVLAVLALRGPQSAGELKTRTERYHPFPDAGAVEEVLRALAARDEPLVKNAGRVPGQSHDRWEQLIGPAPGGGFGPDGPVHQDRAAVGPAGSPAGPPDPDTTSDLARRVEALEDRLAVLERELGLTE